MSNITAGKETKNVFMRCQQGVAYIEFALCIGVLLIMFFGAIEVSRYILIVQKVEKTVDTLTDVLTQSETPSITATDITQYLNATTLLMSPYSVGSNGLVIFTDVKIDAAGVATVGWQVCGGGTMAAASQIASSGVSGSAATLPPGFTPVSGQKDEIVVGEMFYLFTPILAQNVVSPATIYRISVFKLRFETSVSTTSTTCP